MCPCIPLSTLVLVRSMFSFLCSDNVSSGECHLSLLYIHSLVRPLSTRVGFPPQLQETINNVGQAVMLFIVSNLNGISYDS